MKLDLDYSGTARRQGKSELNMQLVGFCIAQNKSLCIGSNNVDALYDKIKERYSEAELTKGEHCVVVEKSK